MDSRSIIRNEKYESEKSKDLKSIMDHIQELQQIVPELLQNYCIINRNIWPLEQIEKMGLNEYTIRSVFDLPKKLYRYYPNDEKDENDNKGNILRRNYSLEALESNTVYLSSPDVFDDVFDSEIYVSPSEFEEHRIKTFARWSKGFSYGEESTEELANNMLQFWHHELLNGCDFEQLFDSNRLGDYEKLNVKNFALEMESELMKIPLDKALKKVIANDYYGLEKELKETFRICCFTTDPMSQLMWGGYAHKHKGFCVEYTVQKNKEYTEIYNNIRPVIYSMRRRSATKAILNAFDKNWDDESIRDLYMNGVLRKSIDWAYQNEWRLLLLPQKRGDKGFVKSFFPISKVYLGNRMCEEKRNHIIEICEKREIPYCRVGRSSDWFKMKEE